MIFCLGGDRFIWKEIILVIFLPNYSALRENTAKVAYLQVAIMEGSYMWSDFAIQMNNAGQGKSH